MNTIQAQGYQVIINKDIYKKLNDYLLSQKISSVFILSDQNTNENCLPILVKNLDKTIKYNSIVVEPGEENKNLDTCSFLWQELTNQGADRRSLLINIGGGVITDMGGFVASTFKRGIRFINIPTTLLSMVDASVGGKTGVDFGMLKNQIGVFSNPEMVLIDTRYLDTLNLRYKTSGLAEIIKYAISYDTSIWDDIIDFDWGNKQALVELIYKSISIKNEIVLEDPKEGHLRKVLNFGHTLGHAVESYFLESKDKKTLTHGEAIAIGMILETFLSVEILGFPKDIFKLLQDKIFYFFPKTNISTSDIDHIFEYLIHDKKNVNGEVKFVLAKDFGKYAIDVNVEKALMKNAIEYYIGV